MRLLGRTFLGMLVCAGVSAQDIKVVGHLEQTINLNSNASSLQAAVQSTKSLRFLKIQLSPTAHAQLSQNAKLNNDQESLGTAKNKQLGMNNVPVLDQGSYGTCVTFANTAAIDAILNQGDYVSQLCLLQLGRYIEENGYTPSGWDGSLGPVVLNEITTFGLISKAQQKTEGCGGLTQYPVMDGDESQFGKMSPSEYHKLSDGDATAQVSWTAVLDANQVAIDKIDPNRTLSQVKSALHAGDRLTFGVLLPAVNSGVAGAVGHHHVTNDTWVLTPEILDEFNSGIDFAGHEMVITGYSDLATAVDDHGKISQGLLTLRNSWGKQAGDKGNFYMSYDYFKTLAIEVQRIRSVPTATE